MFTSLFILFTFFITLLDLDLVWLSVWLFSLLVLVGPQQAIT